MAGSEKYAELSKKIVNLVGGKENITWFTHCVTRLRFTVKDHGLVKKDEIEKIKGVIGSQWSAEQYQIIIGPDVNVAYELICKEHGLTEQDAIDENLGDAPKKKISIGAIIDGISGCITPLLPMLCGSGMIKVLLVMLVQFGIITAESPTYVTLNFMADSAFYFLPVAVGATGARKFGASLSIGIMLGGMLLHPTFTALVAEGDAGSIFGIPITSYNYANTILPMVFTMFICAHVEKFISKHSPAAVQSFLVPMLTLLIMTPITLCAVGPIGAILSDYLVGGIMWLYDTIGFLGIAVLCCLHPILVMTGMHTALIPFVAQCFATTGFDPILGAQQTVSNMNEGVAAFVVGLKTKFDPDLKSEAFSCSATAILAGVTEPALYGVNLKLKKPLMGVMIGNFFGGLVCGILGILRYAYGGANIFGLAVYIGDKPNNLLNMCIAIVVGAVVTFIATWILYKPEKSEHETAQA